ncbi:helix-turn-helix transcriptional regulator [Agromyces sp. Marseille-Q5079]|uniref:helix-turn-helix transcriptional regulator n=1 Tax=Agromyces sp. Marseille-Q5079 TaxID=3439059 RepID=UPI003D9C870C
MVGLQRESRSFHDLGDVQQALDGFFPALTYAAVGRARVLVRMDVATADRFSILDSAWSVPGTAVTDSSDLTVIASGGRAYRLSHGRTEIDPRQSFLAPAEGLAATWETHHASVVVLDLASVEAIARAASGDPSLRLRRTGIAPSSPELATYWSTVLRGIRTTLDESPEILAEPMLAEATFRHLATAFLHAFPTNWLENADGRPGGSAVVRRAVDFMHAHAGEPITVTDVAAAAHISTRGLHFAFTRELGEPPVQMLRRIRLDGVHADLVAAGPETTVSAVARRWGFAHLQRFAEAYRRAFGENPSETLRRG